MRRVPRWPVAVEKKSGTVSDSANASKHAASGMIGRTLSPSHLPPAASTARFASWDRYREGAACPTLSAIGETPH